MTKNRIKFITKIGILSALAAILYIIDIPLWFSPGFYKLDFSSVAALIGSFSLGPLSGILIAVFKNLIKIIITGSGTAFVGEFTDIIITVTFTVPAAVIYKKSKKIGTALIGMITGVVTMTIAGCLLNYYLLIPAYSHLLNLPLDKIVKMGNAVNKRIIDLPSLIIYATAPFNAFKGFVCSVITFLLYKRISKLLHI